MPIQHPYGATLGQISTLVENPMEWASGWIAGFVGLIIEHFTGPNVPPAPEGARWVKAWYLRAPLITHRVGGWNGEPPRGVEWASTGEPETSYRPSVGDAYPGGSVTKVSIKTKPRLSKTAGVFYPCDWIEFDTADESDIGPHYPDHATILEDVSAGIPAGRWGSAGFRPLRLISIQGFPLFADLEDVSEEEAVATAGRFWPRPGNAGNRERNADWAETLGLPGPEILSPPRGGGRPVNLRKIFPAVLFGAAVAIGGGIPAGISTAVVMAMLMSRRKARPTGGTPPSTPDRRGR